jgi:DNA invertase Pin-like site-specific DNA recombinase
MIGNIRSLNIIRYRRKSTEGDEKQIASLPDQAVALDELVTRLGIAASQICEDVEEAKSAKQLGRVGFNTKLIKPIAQGKANAIICWHPDRLSRNAIDTAALVNLMDIGMLQSIITNQQIFWNTPMDKFMLALMCGQAKLENDNKGINVKRGLAGKIRKGWRPGPAPIGYLNNMTKERGERDILVDEERFPLVRKLWDYFLTGNYSVRQLQVIAKNQLMLRTRQSRKQGNKPLSLSHIYRILSDPFYYGWYWWKNTEGDSIELKKGNHIPMITEDDYRRGQIILGRPIKTQAQKHFFPYRGLIRCGECDSQVVGDEKWQIICGNCKKKFASQNKECCPFCGIKIEKMDKKKVLHYVYYHCTKKRNSRCSQKGVRVEDLETQIDDALKYINIGEKYMMWAIETLKDKTKEEVHTQKSIDSNIHKERYKIKGELAELNRFIIKQENAGWSLLTKEDALAEKDRLERELTGVEKNQNASNEQSINWFESCVQTFDYACHARFWFKEGAKEQKRAIFAALGSNLTLMGKKLNISFTYPLEEIKHMIEFVPEITGEFEPKKMIGQKTKKPPYEEKLPCLLRSQNAIRTYFMKTENSSCIPCFNNNPSKI